ncbi:Stk1 family PASTA domain-containing Ser/Thr kinase [Floccifex sp.]|uniref:Stk1 family PASTA domain-containing Ser/Thr kinase n=1 Tax=Floccifex sp. TaxID=2815810 RepID=UPI002A757D85|nr:Stk1 family PASTA domain-containing Ser/Thr kinase [Floccifex sp.]MDD7280962.1 Stk1 family PASTA domain-containing Ser/Thr kinase [Erysipelotrichaceae bacterium]MDY2958689.1 Stk1 family PASTA domain-containing Ser/Thr kinase [Floccifex sp.]
MIKVISNRYEILSLIGQGGMADVYMAQDLILNRIVAIKVLREKLSEDAMTLVRFQREASAASRIHHPNVVDIYDVGEYNGMHYIVMEYIKGHTLKQLIAKRGALPEQEALYIMKQLTSAVLCAHQANIIHRDIKPQNVIVKDDGTVKITDFGIAIASNSVQLTSNNTVMGSAHYLAPETTQGKEPNQQVDIYSLGIVFFELLSGSVPYRGSNPTEIALRHLKDPMPYIRDYNPSIHQSVENIILKATAKDLDDRYHSCEEMLYDLDHCMDSEYQNVRRISFNKKVSSLDLKDGNVEVEYEEDKKIQMRPIIIGALIALVCVIIVVLVLLVSGILRFPGFLGYEEMPDILGLSQEQAVEVLKQDHFDTDLIEYKYEVSDEYEKGQVISSSYDTGDVVKADKEFTIVISKGPSFLIEDYTGLYINDVLDDFAAKGIQLNVNIEYEGKKDTNPGIILEQKGLKMGQRIDPDANETITFVVSDYPTITITKDLLGRDVNYVKEELNEMGIAVVTRPGVSNPLYFTVIDIDPPVGSTYTQEGTDSVVTLYYD